MYTEFYHFKAEPFLLTPDHRFYFESNVHSQAMAHLTYGISRGEGFIVITGEIGAGKTTLVKRLCSSIDTKRILTAHVVTTKVEGVDLLRMVASAFELNDLRADKSSLILRLKTFFESALAQNFRILLIVDEAQNLSESSLEELRMLSNFQFGNIAPFQVFLIGQPQFRATLASPKLEQLRQRVIASYHLGPMDAEECASYVQHRLNMVGWKTDPAFDSSALEEIYARTGGIPRRINTLCSRLLLYGYLEDAHEFTATEVSRVAADLEAENSDYKTNGASIKTAEITSADTDAEAVLSDQQSESSRERKNGFSTLPSPSEPTESDRTTLQRLDALEKQLMQQKDLLRRAASVVRDFLEITSNKTK